MRRQLLWATGLAVLVLAAAGGAWAGDAGNGALSQRVWLPVVAYTPTGVEAMAYYLDIVKLNKRSALAVDRNFYLTTQATERTGGAK